MSSKTSVSNLSASQIGLMLATLRRSCKGILADPSAAKKVPSFPKKVKAVSVLRDMFRPKVDLADNAKAIEILTDAAKGIDEFALDKHALARYIAASLAYVLDGKQAELDGKPSTTELPKVSAEQIGVVLSTLRRYCEAVKDQPKLERHVEALKKCRDQFRGEDFPELAPVLSALRGALRQIDELELKEFDIPRYITASLIVVLEAQKAPSAKATAKPDSRSAPTKPAAAKAPANGKTGPPAKQPQAAQTSGMPNDDDLLELLEIKD